MVVMETTHTNTDLEPERWTNPAGTVCALTPPPDDDGTCEHGLSARLCAGPNHYPADVR